MATQHLTSASATFVGAGDVPVIHAANSSKGAPVTFIYKAVLGSPIALDTNALVAAATSTNLPNAATKTYTTANAGTAPINDAGLPTTATVAMADGQSYSVFPLDVARNVTVAATHATSLAALSVTVTGFGLWGTKVVETLAITATGTSKTAAGKKAFRWIQSIAITAVGDATADTVNIGFGDVLGLPYALQKVSDHLRVYHNDVADTTATVVKADATTATATTGDVRGTVAPSSACDATEIAIWYHIDGSTNAGLVGIAQFSG